MNAGISSGPAGVRGLDVSHYQGNIDWSRVAQAGMAFAFIKATQGTAESDPAFQANWNGAKTAGLLRGAYHFYMPGEDPRQQAENFLRVAHTGTGDLPPVLDVETNGEPSEIIEGIEAWLTAVEQATGKTPILYTDPGFWATLGTSNFGRFPLWIADYSGAITPRVPEGWETWTFWQFSRSGSVSGITELPVDLDVFHGTLSDLQQWTQS